LNLFNCPTVAYSGENDRQKQAADVMARALQDEGIELVHVIGAKAGHQFSDRSWVAHFRKVEGVWQPAASADEGTVRKRHGLQGPIDDAFMDRFIMVRPTGQSPNAKVGQWAAAELRHAIDHWRRQFRGEARVNNARQVPKLPDYAVIDVDVPVSSRAPGGIVTAGFFTEEWTLPAAK